MPTYSLADSSLAIIDARVQQSEDAPAVGTEYRFQPGDYLHFSFGIAGFEALHALEGQTQKIALEYKVIPEDAKGIALAPAETGSIKTELSPEDKNWTPKRRASFLLPSFVAAGEFHVRVVVQDLLAKTETSKSFPFHVGGVAVPPTDTVTVSGFQFLRREDDREALEVPAFAPGDSVFARFTMSGFRVDAKNTHHLAYGIVVLRPDGKPYLQQPTAAELTASSFYPAQYLPGDIKLTTSKDTSKGTYVLVLTVRDLIGQTSQESKFPFTIE